MITEAPLYINWNYTYKCNLNCKHCYSRDKSEVEDELSTAQYIKIVDKLAEAKVFQVNLGGGEPTLRADYLEIIKHISDKGMKANLSSNGWFITEKISEELKNSNVGTVFISLDNIIPKLHDDFRSKEGSFERAINATKLCVDKGIEVVFSTVITKLNYDCLEDIVKFAKELGVARVDFKRFKIKGNGLINSEQLVLTKPQEDLLYDKIKMMREKYEYPVSLVYGETPFEDIDQGCPCGKTSLGLTPSGEILPCVYNKYSIGNILKEDLRTIWKTSPKLIQMRKSLTCMGFSDL